MSGFQAAMPWVQDTREETDKKKRPDLSGCLVETFAKIINCSVTKGTNVSSISSHLWNPRRSNGYAREAAGGGVVLFSLLQEIKFVEGGGASL